MQFYILGRDISKPFQSQEFHLRCEIYVQHQDQPLPVLFSWTTDEDGTLKRIPLYNDRKSVPHGVGKYAWKVSLTKSELVIEQVREADLKLYSCWVKIGNEVKSQNVTLIKKSKSKKITFIHSDEFGCNPRRRLFLSVEVLVGVGFPC